MENNRGHRGKTNQEIDSGGTQPQNRREATHYEFEGMNFEQQRETYRIDKSLYSQNDPIERNDSHRRANDI